MTKLEFTALDAFGNNFFVIDPWYWDSSGSYESWRDHQRRKYNIIAGSCKNNDFCSPQSPWRIKSWISHNKRSSYSMAKSKGKIWPLKVHHTSSSSLWLVELEVARF